MRKLKAILDTDLGKKMERDFRKAERTPTEPYDQSPIQMHTTTDVNGHQYPIET